MSFSRDESSYFNNKIRWVGVGDQKGWYFIWHKPFPLRKYKNFTFFENACGGMGRFSVKLAPKTRLWEGGFSLVRISSLLWSHTVTPRSTAQIGNLKFQKCDKARTGSPGRQAAAWWPLMKWLLKEVGRLIPAAERRAGQRPRNAQPGGGRIAAASQPRARPKTDSLCSFSLSGRGVASFRAIGTLKAVWDKRYQCHFKSRRWLGVSESYLRSMFRKGAHNLGGRLLGDSC